MQPRTSRVVIAALALFGLAGGATRQARAEEIVAITARLTGVDAAPSIFSFDSATPGAISAPVPLPLTGMPLANQLQAIDFRPSTGQLYGITGLPERLFTVDTATGQVTPAATLGTIGTLGAGLDFDPVTDELRLFSDRGEGLNRLNLRVNPDTGQVAQGPLLRYAEGDVNFGRMPNLQGLAYNNSVAGAAETQLYGIDVRTLVRVDAGAGLLHTVGPLGWNFLPLLGRYLGFDISGETGVAYAAVARSSSLPELYTVDLGTGAATLVGRIGDGTAPLPVIGIAVAPAVIPEPTSLLLLGTGLLGAGASAVRRRRKAGASQDA